MVMKELQEMKSILSNQALHSREGIIALSDHIESLPDSLGEDPFPLIHSFSDGLYSREIHLPKGYLIVGKLHKHESMVYILKGKVFVADENGYKEIEAPAHFVSKPWIKRIGYVVEDVVWIDIHHVESENVEDAEKEIFADNYEDIDMLGYEEAIEELGYSEREVRAISERKFDIIEQPEDYKGLTKIDNSDIEGKGVFALTDFSEGDAVGVGRVDNNRTDLGRYTNHSSEPNVKCTLINKEVLFEAIKPIHKNEEITIDYRDTKKMAEAMDKIGWSACQA